jgi:single-strand DNA-binding protein
VAVSSAWTDTNTGERREKTNWYKCAAWGKQAEIANQYIKKGTQVQVIGTVEARAYMSNDGEPKASLELRVSQFILLGGRGESTSNDDSQYEEARGNMDSIPF